MADVGVPEGGPIIVRRYFVTDRDGVEHEILTSADLQAILDQMTPDELETWKARYRFAPVQNNTKNMNYTGTGRDI